MVSGSFKELDCCLFYSIDLPLKATRWLQLLQISNLHIMHFFQSSKRYRRAISFSPFLLPIFPSLFPSLSPSPFLSPFLTFLLISLFLSPWTPSFPTFSSSLYLLPLHLSPPPSPFFTFLPSPFYLGSISFKKIIIQRFLYISHWPELFHFYPQLWGRLEK